MNTFESLTRLLPASLRLLFASPNAHSEQAQRLAGILNVEVSELASMCMGARFHYRPFAIAKPDGREPEQGRMRKGERGAAVLVDQQLQMRTQLFVELAVQPLFPEYC
jgi:hypothetical protein